MKLLLTSLFVCLYTISSAQIVNIPDINFKGELLRIQGLDANSDGEIQVTEALTLRDLTVYSEPNNLTGIRAFANLERLFVSNAAEIILDSLTKLRYLKIYCGINSRNFSVEGCTGLDTLMLESVGDNGGGFQAIKLNSCVNLSYLLINAIRCRTFEMDNCHALRSILIQEIDLTSPVDFSQMSELQTLNLVNCNNTFGSFNFDFTNLSRLEKVDIGLCDAKQFNFSGCTNLRSVWIGVVRFFSPTVDLDFSESPLLSSLELRDFEDTLRHLNLKNGSLLSLIWVDTATVHIQDICADENEIEWLSTVLGGFGPTANINSYCSPSEGGANNIVRGQIRIDVNSNGCDSFDPPGSLIPIRFRQLPGSSFIQFSDELGQYEAGLSTGNFSIQPYFPYPYYSINPAIANVRLDSANSPDQVVNFCISPVGIHNDLEITYLPTFRSARPGFQASYRLIFKNRGTSTMSGTIQLNFDGSRLNFASASTTPVSQNTGQLNWSYSNLHPFETGVIDCWFSLLPPPVNNLDDTLIYIASISPSNYDETPFDNTFILPQRVTGAVDPNDKQCLEGSTIDISKIGDYLHYLVRFQNEGTDTAFNIVVADTLSDNLDWSSFELTETSHPATTLLKDNRALFFFQHINLPYKAINEPASNGWVAFKIKPKATMVAGDSINNSAAIYFDFNLPVITNMVSTRITVTSTPLPIKLEYFSINSRNNTNILHWKAACTNGTASFSIERSGDGIHFSSIGNIAATAQRCQLPFNFTDEQPLAGKNYYRLKITDADGKSFYSKVIVVGNNKSGISITSIAGGKAFINVSQQQNIRWQLIAADGRLLEASSKLLNPGPNQIQLNNPQPAAGIYLLIIQTNNGETITTRFKQ